MKILFYGYPVGTGDAPHQAMAAIYLARQGHSVDYYCWGGSMEDLPVPAENLRYRPLPKKGWKSAFALLFKMIRCFAAKERYDVLYVQGAQQTPFMFMAPFLKRGKKIIYHTQDYLEPGRHRFYERFERWFSLRADYVICNEMNRARFMKSNYGLKYLPAVVRTVLPAWWNIPERNVELRKDIVKQAGIDDSENTNVIIAGGTYRADRMSPQLLEAFAQLPDNNILVFNGPAMNLGGHCRRNCEGKMAELGLSSRVVFLGGQSFEGLLSLYSVGEIGIMLYPNDGVGHYYQCPGRFSEYIRNGLSLVSSDFMGLELLTLKYELGAVCDSENPASIATALLQAGCTARELRNKIIKTANIEFVYEREASVLDEILAGTYEHPVPSVLT